jgi:predicted DNA-binding protein
LIEEHLDDLEDIAMAERRLKAGGKRLTLAQVRKNLGLDY